jgi:hypothetical protein
MGALIHASIESSNKLLMNNAKLKPSVEASPSARFGTYMSKVVKLRGASCTIETMSDTQLKVATLKGEALA